MLGDPSADDGSDEQNAMLRRLAKALDVAPAAFFDSTVGDLSLTTELLRLWHGLRDTQHRAEVLAMVQSTVRTIESRA